MLGQFNTEQSEFAHVRQGLAVKRALSFALFVERDEMLFTESARCLDQSFLISTDGEVQRSRHHDPSARAAPRRRPCPCRSQAVPARAVTSSSPSRRQVEKAATSVIASGSKFTAMQQVPS